MKINANRLGETRTMNNGQKATIIQYRGSKDITVCFEDKTEVKTQYCRFCNGKVRNPNFHLGETKAMKNGLTATIIAYRNTKDVDIRFEDGVILMHKQYCSFKSGTLLHPKLGETRMMHCGKTATIIVYRNNNDIDIQFGDGTVVTHKNYSGFKRGKIACPNNVTKYTINDRSRLNETKTMKNGLKATIVEYTTYHDITVLFEDGCKVHSCYEYFKKGTITTRTGRLNQTVVQNNGLKATIIAYRKNDDIDIQFEDGTILKRKRYSDFRKGAIVNPNKKER